jgi:hypothetical protein
MDNSRARELELSWFLVLDPHHVRSEGQFEQLGLYRAIKPGEGKCSLAPWRHTREVTWTGSRRKTRGEVASELAS